MEEMLIEKVRQRILLYDTKSPDYRDQHRRVNAWEGIGKELKIKRNFYVNSRDVRIVCPRLISQGHCAGQAVSWGSVIRTLSPDYRDQHMRANAWEWIGKEVKIKLSFM